eukprot:TRINITY_DN4008_c0_g1_i1.p1 TRINITY_DN4008_c0_g1~~TRINITY_DN4008_c0_g1_i1.p1  ORF type:complete len:503 (+),score=147.31 TRINITY_DN4008_c0_g1_i1:970-2478(+)
MRKGVDETKLQRVYFHKLGTSQSEDRLIYGDESEENLFYSVAISEDQEYLILRINENCSKSNKLFYVKWNEEKEKTGMITANKLIDKFEAQYSFVDSQDSTFFLLTNKDAMRNKLVKVDLSKPTEFVDVIPETFDVLQWAKPVNNDLFLVSYLKDVKTSLQLYNQMGKLVKDFNIPIGEVVSLSTKKNWTEFYFKFASFLSPGTTYHYDFINDKMEVWHQTEVKGIELDTMETEQIFYNSDDGTRIPMFVVRKKDMKKDGKNPSLFYGYGGFGISLTPVFSVALLLWVHHYNAVLAIPNLRGGDEYGEDWHQGGTMERKQNVFDDFKSAARELTKLGYSNPKQTAILGGSNGGLLVAACTNQNPELFGAAVAQVGVLDMLRFHKFTVGYAWTSEYGCSDNAKDFEYLFKYSPLHTVKTGKEFPSLLLTTADHDDRAVPLHSFKYIAEVQHKLGNEPYQGNPLLIRVEEDAGHGQGKPVSKVLEETADVFGFIANQVEAKWLN